MTASVRQTHISPCYITNKKQVGGLIYTYPFQTPFNTRCAFLQPFDDVKKYSRINLLEGEMQVQFPQVRESPENTESEELQKLGVSVEAVRVGVLNLPEFKRSDVW
jgi:hypothetical protein